VSAPDAPEHRTLKEWLSDIETRVRRLEHAVWAFGGVIAVLQFLRACGGN
jgi:hypothetical protein